MDRATPLFEALVGDDVVFDVGEDGGQFDIAFHEAALKYTIEVNIFSAVVADAKARILASAASE